VREEKRETREVDKALNKFWVSIRGFHLADMLLFLDDFSRNRQAWEAYRTS